MLLPWRSCGSAWQHLCHRSQVGIPFDFYLPQHGRHHHIYIFQPDGKPSRHFGEQGGADGKFHRPWALALHPKGDLVICDLGKPTSFLALV